jgi:replication factor A2
MTVANGVGNNGEHTLFPVMAKMIHSAVWDLERFVLKDGRLLHMVKLVSAVRNFLGNIKHVQIDVEDGTGLVRVILWRGKKECMAQRCLIDKCNSNRYIHVIGEVKDYYGVHKKIAFDVRPVSSGNEVTHHLLEVAYSF